MLGLGSSLVRGGFSLLTYIKDGLKLYMPYKKGDGALQFVGTGSTSFDGVDNYIFSGSNTGISGASARTISAWAKASTTSQDSHAMIVVIGGGDALKGMWFGADVSSTNWMFSFWGSSDDYDTSVALDTNWHHFALTLDSGSYVGYIDGVAKVSGSTSGTVNTTNSKLYAGYHLTTSARWDGYICNVGVWTGVLSQPQIKSIMWKNYAGLTSTETTGLVSWWNLDEADGSTVEDLHGSNDGTLA